MKLETTKEDEKLRRLFSYINEKEIILPEVVYHYCPLESFMKIIESGYLFLSHQSAMNDFTDSEYFFHILCNVANSIITKENEFLIRNFIDNFRINIKDYFIACFSSEKDILSQWTMYADEGRGVCIGFKTDTLQVKPQLPNLTFDPSTSKGVFPIEYFSQKTDSIAEDLLDLVSNKIINNDFLSVVDKLILTKKHISFNQEKEIRIVEIQDTRFNSNPDFPGLRTPYVGKYYEYRIKNNNQIIPYRKHQFRNDDTEFYLNSIWLGPECKTEKKVIKLFLNKYKVKIDDDIYYSHSPFVL